MAWFDLDLLLLLLLCAAVIRLLFAARNRARRPVAPADVPGRPQSQQPPGTGAPPRGGIVIDAVTYMCDPIDGTPFSSGEPVLACDCGTAYRRESRQWLAEFRGGCCINCGAHVELQPLTIVPS